MKDQETPSLPRGERAGPLFLLALLVGAFVPSVFISFDLQSLIATMAAAAVASSSGQAGAFGLPSLSAADTGGGEGMAPAELPAVYQVSSGSGGSTFLASSLEASPRGIPAQPVAGSHEWPPGPASSPRSPPSPAAYRRG